MDTLFWLIVGHAIADYPLQGDYLARGKDRHSPLNQAVLVWPHCLLAHSLIHGGMVALVTGSVLLGLAEVVVHALIDFGKCERWYGYHADQAWHVAWKLVWAVLSAHAI